MTFTIHIYELAETAYATFIKLSLSLFNGRGPLYLSRKLQFFVLCPVWVQGLLPRDIN